MSFSTLVNGSRLPVLFVGSGISRRYMGTPDWEGLLKEVYFTMGRTEQDYKTLKAKEKNDPENRSLTEGELNAVIASKMEEAFNKHYYEGDLKNEYPKWLDDYDVSPFKNCIAMIIDKFPLIEEKKEEISLLQKLRGKVASIVTTNYDTLLENVFVFHKDSVFIGQSQMFDPLSVEIDELYKIHGCVTQPGKIIITASDYENYKVNAKLFSAKLLTLISEHPVVFIGYRIGDPNIQQALVDLVSCLTTEQVHNLKDHFYLIEYKEGIQKLEEKEYLFTARSYEGKETPFPISVISTDNYMEVYNQLSKLTPAMNINAVKQVKRIVKDIVVESTAAVPIDEPIITVLLDDIYSIDKMAKDQKLAIAIGEIDSIRDFGYGLKPKTEIFEDILSNNQRIDSNKILKGTYEKHYLKIKTNLPIFKYVNGIEEAVLDECPNVRSYVEKHSSIEAYLNSSLIKYLRTVPEGNCIKDIPKEYAVSMRKRYLWIFKNINRIEKDNLKEFLLSELQKYESMSSNEKSDFNRLISMYDLLVYK